MTVFDNHLTKFLKISQLALRSQYKRPLAPYHVMGNFYFSYYVGLQCFQGLPGGSDSKNLPAVQETQVRSLGREDTLENRMATHSSILAWRNPWTEEPHGATVHGVAKSWTWLNN